MKFPLELGSILFAEQRIDLASVIGDKPEISHPFSLHPIPCRQDIAWNRIVGSKRGEYEGTRLRPVREVVFPAINIGLRVERQTEGHGGVARG